MGQYFKLINESKKEQIIGWALGGATAKFYEWLYNNHARVLVWLLRRSEEGGGGDIPNAEKYKTLGCWAGDKVSLIGDYDSSGLYEESKNWKNIAVLVRKEYNRAIKEDRSDGKYGL